MKLPEIGVKRPVATAMLFVAIILLGLVAMKMLPLDVMPELEYPSITIITIYPGASANEVEEQVSKPLEAVLSGAEYLKDIKSISKENVSFIQLSYNWNTDVTAAANNARDLMELVKSRLPKAAESPIIFKINSSMMPILGYSINATSNYNGIEKIIEDKIATPLRKVDGVGTVIYLGQPEREISISVDPRQLKAYNLSVSEISTILQAENINIPAGNIKVGVFDFSVRVPGKFETVENIENIALKAFNGKVVRLKDVATVQDTFAEKEAYARNHLGEGVALLVQKQTGENTLEVVQAVRKEMEKIEKTLPHDVQINEMISTDEMVTESVKNLTSSIFYALIFVTLVVLMFLREWRSSLIIFVTMPVSLISAFIVMYIMDYTINIFSLMSLIIAIGMVVDNAIVVLENVTQHIERGTKPKQAAIFGTSEMGMAIAASTATTLVVFLPMVFMGGIVGIMFKQLAILTCVCMIMSLFTALTLTPMLASQLLKRKGEDEDGKEAKRSKFYRWSENVFNKIEYGYKNLLAWTVVHKGVVIVSAVVVFIGVMLLGKKIGTDYIPDFDAGSFALSFETEVGTSVEQTDSIGQQILKILHEEIHEMVPGSSGAIAGQTRVGALTTVGFKEGKNIGSVLCHLTLPNKRKRTAEEIADAVRKRLDEIPQIEKYQIQAGSILAAAVTGNKRPVEIHVSGDDLDVINKMALSFEEKLKAREEFKDVETSVDNGKIEVQIVIDKEKASQMALNTALIGMQIRQNLFGAESGEFTEGGDDYDIKIRYAPEFRNDIDKLKEMQLTNLLGKQVSLSSVAEIKQDVGLLEIQRESQQRFVLATANLNDVSLGKGAKIAQAIIDDTEILTGSVCRLEVRLLIKANHLGSVFDTFPWYCIGIYGYGGSV